MMFMNYIKLVSGILITLMLGIFAVTRIAVEAIGWSTTPSDLDALIKKMPSMFRWLFSTPWPYPTFIVLSIAAFAAWLLWSGTKKTVSDEIADTKILTEEDIKRMVAESTKSNGTDIAYVKKAMDDALASLKIKEFQTTVAIAIKDVNDAAEKTRKRVDDVAQISNAGRDAGLNELSEQVEKLAEFVQQRYRNISDRLDWVSQGFAAVGVWDWHVRHFPPILAAGLELATAENAPISDELWGEWDKAERKWRSDVGAWLQSVSYYAPDSHAKVIALPDDIYYDAEWFVDWTAFSNPDRVRRYKELAIAAHNLVSCSEYVERCIRSAAFEGVGKKGRLDDPPSLNEYP